MLHQDKTIEELVGTFECLVISGVPEVAASHQMTLLQILVEEEMIPEWKASKDGEGGYDIAIFGWGEPRLPDDEDEEDE